MVYAFNALNGLIVEIDTLVDSHPNPQACLSSQSTGNCNLRSAYYACQQEYQRHHLCTFLLGVDDNHYLMQWDHYGKTFNESLSTEVIIHYRDKETSTIEKGQGLCCFSCLVGDQAVDCSLVHIDRSGRPPQQPQEYLCAVHTAPLQNVAPPLSNFKGSGWVSNCPSSMNYASRCGSELHISAGKGTCKAQATLRGSGVATVG